VLTYANPQMLAYFGDRKFLSGTRIGGVHPDDAQRVDARWKSALAKGRSIELEMRLQRADGEYRWHLVRAQPLLDEERRVERWFGVNFDVEDLKRAQEAAEHSTRMKSAFLSSMSHEIRTPMNAVLGFSSLLAGTALDTRQQEFLTSIRASGEHLLGVINNILDFSKMEAGLLELDPHPFALRPLAEAAVDIVSPNAADQGVELGCLIREHVPAGIVADEGRLRQVLVNLLGNAVKFTARGEVVLTVDARRTGTPGEWELQFSVRDTGIGIPEDVLPRLFQEFTQGESSTQRRFGGSGLGLAISKRIIELHGGRIWAESVERRGSTFHVVLPAREATGIAADAEPVELAGRRLLAVDDNAANLEILTLQAQAWGMTVQATGDPREALALVRDGARFDIAVIDHRMPFMDGVALAQALHAERAGTGLPLVMLSSLGARVNAPQLSAVLTKPIHQSSLKQALRAALRLDVPTAAEAEAAPASDLSGMTVLLAEDNLLNQRVARLLLDRVGLTADSAFNGREAVEAVQRRDYDVVLMDVEMPEMDGLEAAGEIVRELGERRPWLIAVTAQALQGDRERCLAAGFDDYLSKPLSTGALGAALARVPRRAQEAPAASDECPDFNAEEFEKMRESYGDEAVAEIVEALEIDLPQQTADFGRSRANGDFKTFSRVAHTFKSSSRMFGAESLAQVWQALESSGRTGAIDHAAADAAFARYRALVTTLDRRAKVS
jgi:PAS domain S-box-containing protein